MLVTICCATYQHERFIADALRGFLGQVTSFPFKVLVRDDASTDRTGAIILAFAKHYPLLITPIIEPINQYHLGVLPGTVFEPLIEGEFIATCEGDDYWISPTKLQSQVALLLAYPASQVAATRSFEINDGDQAPHSIVPSCPKDQFNSDAIMLYGQWPKTLTRLSRLSWYKKYSKEVPQKMKVDNTYVKYTVMRGSDDPSPILLVDSCMGVYRKHPGGIFTGSTPLQIALRSIYKAAFLKSVCFNDKWRIPLHAQLANYTSVIILSRKTSLADKSRAFACLRSHSSMRELIAFCFRLASGSASLLYTKLVLMMHRNGHSS